MDADDGFDGAIETIGQLVDALDSLTGEAVSQAIGEAAVEIIRERTAAGRDVDGQPFAPYTPRYAAKRREMGLGTSRVDLEVTGEMLGGLTAQVDRDGVVITVEGDGAARAAAHNSGTSRLPQREFMDIRQPSEVDKLGELARDVALEHMGKRLR